MPLAHVRLLVEKFAECFRFYSDTLGLRPSWGDEAHSYASFTESDSDKIVLALYRRQAMAQVVGTAHLPVDAPGQDRCVLVFQVVDVDATVEDLRQRGVQFVAGPADFRDWGIRSAYLRDPDGNLIELYSDLPADGWSDELRAAAEKWTT